MLLYRDEHFLCLTSAAVRLEIVIVTKRVVAVFLNWKFARLAYSRLATDTGEERWALFHRASLNPVEARRSIAR